ncbi:MAG: sugar phosphate isomerase/epimerase [Saprospiraceae bacterium]|nr:sugar phosphate isomerase/epimerase [Saprospiraceae bacterium]
MIFISTSCIKSNTIRESIEKLVKHGFHNIELSGGTRSYPELESDLLNLKKQHNLNFTIHNYFPPPQEPFVINIASENEEIRKKSLNHFQKGILLAQKLDVDKIGMHAGFYIDPNACEIGSPLSYSIVAEKSESLFRFIDGFNYLQNAAGNIKLYIENNVISKSNFETYGKNPLMLTCYSEYIELRKLIDFPLILDVAHLFVSSNTLGLEFESEIKALLKVSDYLHLSNNEGIEDSNSAFEEKSEIFNFLLQNKKLIKNKTITLEIYENIEVIKKSHQIISNLFE